MNKWLVELPPKWQSNRLKTLVSLNTERVNEKNADDNYLGLENIESWTGRLIKSDAVTYNGDDPDENTNVTSNRFDTGDVLFGKLRPYLAKAHIAEQSGICTTELLVMKPGKQINSRFLLNVILTREFIGQVDAESFGAKMPRADWNTVSNIYVPLPPLSEQRTIADYLDRVTAKIDTLIAAKQRLLDLLAEKRRALITHAVTRGLDATVPLRDSGVEWLGEIPGHWTVVRLKFLIFGIEHGFSPQCYNFPAEEGGWGVLKTGCVNGGVFDPQENKALPDDIDPPTEIQVDIGDVLMSRASGSLNLIGSVALVGKLDGANLLLSDKTFRLLVNAAICDKQFFVSVMGSFPLRQQILQAVSGAAGLANNIAQSDINELLLPLPPLSEQNEIIDFLKQSITPLDKLSSRLSLTINLLQERRSALIAAAVTGKLSVVSCN